MTTWATPYSVPVLVARVRNLWRRVAPAPVSPRERAFVLEDRSRFAVERQGVIQGAAQGRLTRLESRLLGAVCQHAGRPLSAEQLLARVQGDDTESHVAVIKTHIRHLRAKVGRLPSQPRPIYTVQGRGYLV